MIRQDLTLHFLAGFFISTVANMIAVHFGNSHLIWVGAIAAMVFGAGKELIWDLWWKKGTPDWKDFMLTAIGGSLAIWVDLIKLA